MTEKIVRFYASAPLDDESKSAIAASFAAALDRLEDRATMNNRSVLWGTVGTDVSRLSHSVQRLVDPEPTTIAGPTFINVEADCIRLSPDMPSGKDSK